MSSPNHEPAPPPLLEGVGLKRTAGDTTILDGIDLQLSEGEILVLVGPSGSGKSTCLRALALLDRLQGGEVRYRGELIPPERAVEHRARVVYLSQTPVLFERSVREEIQAFLAFEAHAARRPDAPSSESLLARVDRGEDFLERETTDLSGGERQLVALLRALILDPDILLLDEPTASIDTGTSRKVEEIVTGWMTEEKGRGIIWTTHDREQAERVGDRFLLLVEGRVAYEGTSREELAIAFERIEKG